MVHALLTPVEGWARKVLCVDTAPSPGCGVMGCDAAAVAGWRAVTMLQVKEMRSEMWEYYNLSYILDRYYGIMVFLYRQQIYNKYIRRW